jgi:hypothetical protein
MRIVNNGDDNDEQFSGSELNVKQWGAIFQLVLDNDTDSLKADLVLLDSMAESP